MIDVSGDGRQSQHALTLTQTLTLTISLTLNPNPVTLRTSELSTWSTCNGTGDYWCGGQWLVWSWKMLERTLQKIPWILLCLHDRIIRTDPACSTALDKYIVIRLQAFSRLNRLSLSQLSRLYIVRRQHVDRRPKWRQTQFEFYTIILSCRPHVTVWSTFYSVQKQAPPTVRNSKTLYVQCI